MRNIPSLYYLLTLLLIVGGFASMAQNDYGLELIGFSAIGFTVLFLFQSIKLILKKYSLLDCYEYLGLSIISLILAFRALYIHFDFVAIIFSIVAFSLFLLYIKKSIGAIQQYKIESKEIKYGITSIYISISLFFLAFSLTPISPEFSEIPGGLSFGLLILFSILNFRKRKVKGSDNLVYPVNLIVKRKDPSLLIASIIVIFSMYVGMNKFGIIPKLYSNEFPQAYLELIQRAENGDEEMENGKFKHELFKENYDKILDRYINKED